MASFQLKNFVSIAASMINRLKATQTQITDFNVGAIGRTLVEAPAIEIEELYQQAFNLVTAAIPVSVYNSFNFPALPALGATGLIRVSITAQPTVTLVAAGTIFSVGSSSFQYSSNSDVTISAGSTFGDCQVTATTTGAGSNIAAGTSFTTTPAITGFVSAINQSAFVNGQDAETDDERLIRFNSYISTLSRATVAAIGYGLSTVSLTDSLGNITEQVRLYSVVEPYVLDPTQPIALVNAYIHNGVGDTSGALQAQAQLVINGYTQADGTKVPGWKAAGVPCNIILATEAPLAVTGVLTIADNFSFDDVMPAVTTVVFTYLQDLGISQTAIQSELISLIMAVAGVADVSLTAPTGNTTAGVGVKIMPGAITFTDSAAAS